jgi:hypothetical protein
MKPALMSAMAHKTTSERRHSWSASCHEQSLRIFQSPPAQSPSPGLAEKYLLNFPVSSQRARASLGCLGIPILFEMCTPKLVALGEVLGSLGGCLLV